MTLPTKWTLFAGMPSRARFSLPAGSVVKSRSEIASVRMRLISSGMPRSKLRRPASTCATGRPSLTAVRAAATVEFTSPTTSTTSGRIPSTTGSRRVMMSAIWVTAPEDCTFRLTSGRGISRFAKNESDICAS